METQDRQCPQILGRVDPLYANWTKLVMRCASAGVVGRAGVTVVSHDTPAAHHYDTDTAQWFCKKLVIPLGEV